jgi:predicted esterase
VARQQQLFVPVVVIAALALDCQRRDLAGKPPRDAPEATAPARSTPASPQSTAEEGAARVVPTTLAPLRDASWLEPLDLGDGDAAVVSVPLGAVEPRPLVVAIHGAHDRPEWACGGWRLGFDVYPFIVCPRGTPVTKDKFAWSGSAAIERVLLKSVVKVRERFGDYVAPAPHVYAGFSQGAIYSEPILLRHAGTFPTAILAEGGYPILRSRKFATDYRAAGGSTVVIICGSPACRRTTQSSIPMLESAGLRVFESGDVRSGHNLNRLMQQALLRDFRGWFEGDAAWSHARGQAAPLP